LHSYNIVHVNACCSSLLDVNVDDDVVVEVDDDVAVDDDDPVP
jgi:hypothetical protein